ncbi:hypothetical protein JG687_00000413 [Phytophthora cactorum]|uniref:Uncharacterized protein n=1 Tax=Phytophthora cactorum TaxID=29920 RepID=A0A8T1V2R4_9STRA|nr:hypothetical protein C6341_g4467 [Phytophthora cactorum]KAG6974288.1 hypothetical protein JG687_00000413 [Phytophthora cactorum]
MYEVRHPGSWLKYHEETAESGGERAEKYQLRICVESRKRRGGRKGRTDEGRGGSVWE